MTENETTLILAFIDIKAFSIKWSINCEFEVKGGELVLDSNDEPIFDVQVDSQSQDLLILQTTSLTRLKFPFNSEKDENNSIILISKLSKSLQTVLRVVDDVKGQLIKLLKLDDSVFIRLSEIDHIRKLLLFGSNDTSTSCFNIDLSESEVLDWKSKLKKQHAELLVSVQEVSSVIRSFSKNYPNFCNAEIDRFLEIDLIQLEDKSRLLQHDLAEFLVWLENLVIPAVNPNNSLHLPFKPESRALELVKSIKRSEDSIIERHELWSNAFNDFKLILDLEFKDIITRINSINLESIERIENIPKGFNRIISTNPLILLHENRNEIFKDSKVTVLSDEYIAHYYKNHQLHLICKGSHINLTDTNNTQCSDLSNDHDPSDDNIFVNPLSNQIYLVPSINPTKLKIKW